MVDKLTDNTSDEIDLRELFLTIWSGRYLIALAVAASILLAAFVLHSSERKYTVSYTFQPVADDNNTPNFSGLGGLASLAGVSLPSASSGDFQTFKILLQSEETAEQLMASPDIVRQIFEGEWSDETKSFKQQEASPIGRSVQFFKKLLTGSEKADYTPPNAARLAVWLSKNFSAAEDRDTGMLKLTSETPNPQLIIDVMTATTAITDTILKDRYLSSARQSVEFYQNKISAARSRESREALAQLIAQEQQKLMLASNGSFFVAQPLTRPSVSLQPTSPKSSLVLALAIVLGSFIGSAIVLIRKALQND